MEANHNNTCLSHNKEQCPWGYCGGRQAPHSLLIFFRYREYWPQKGRWLTKDPAGYLDGYNLYQFVQNNPMRWCDPYGLSSQDTTEENSQQTPPSQGFVDGVLEGYHSPIEQAIKEGDSRHENATPNVPDIPHIEGNTTDDEEERRKNFNYYVGYGIGRSYRFVDDHSGKIAIVTGVCTLGQGLIVEGGIAAGTACTLKGISTIGRSCGFLRRVVRTQQSLSNRNFSIRETVTAENSLTRGTAEKTLDVAREIWTGSASTGKWSSLFRQDAEHLRIPYSYPIPKGNNDYGMRHILKRHAFDTTAKRVSRFLEGWNENDIGSIIKQAFFESGGSFRNAKNGSRIYEAGLSKNIGYSRDGNPTNQIRIIIHEDNTITSAFPY